MLCSTAEHHCRRVLINRAGWQRVADVELAVNFRVASPRFFCWIRVGATGGRMDATSAWLHNINIDRTLNRLGTYIDPSKRATLLKILIEEEDKLGTGPDQLERAARRVREGQARIYRTLVVIERLIDCGLMDEETFSKALE